MYCASFMSSVEKSVLVKIKQDKAYFTEISVIFKNFPL